MPVLLIVTLLITQALAAASRPTAYSTTKLYLHAGNFVKNVFFGNNDPFRYVLHMVYTHLRAKFHHHTYVSEEIGPDKINKLSNI